MSNDNKKTRYQSTFHKFSLEVPDPTIPRIIESKMNSWISYGVDNLYPNNLITALYNGSAINRSCIDSKQIAMVGEGLRTTNPDLDYILKNANLEGEGWNEIFDKASLDYIIYGGFGINILWNQTGSEIVEMYNLDFNDVRSGHIDYDTDKVEWYYYSSDWTKYKKDVYRPKAFKAFSKKDAGLYPNQILYFFNHAPGQKYYPLPSWSGSTTDCQIDISVSSYHYWNLMNGLSPSLFVQMNNGIPSAEERRDVYEEIASTFSGVDGAGKFFLSFAPDKDHNTEVTPIQSANDDYYITLEQRITSRILTGHRITSPLLLGIKDSSNGFSSNADEITVAYQHFVSTVIEPDQKILLKVFNKLVKFYGYETELYIEQKKLFNKNGNQTGGEAITGLK